MKSRLRARRTVLRLEPLERRDAPATLVSATKLTYQDADGDNVTVTFSKPFLNAGNANDVFEFDTGTVNGSNTTKQQLRKIDVTGIGAPAAGTTITTVATRSPATGGDGFAALGHIAASAIDLGAVNIDGDLGKISCGDGTSTTNGLKGLTAHSLGRYGLSTGAPDSDVRVTGKLDFLRVKSDVRDVNIRVLGGGHGKIGSILVGGSLIGATGFDSGTIQAEGDIGPVTILGDVVGGTGDSAGGVQTIRRIASVTIGGSLRGGSNFGAGVLSALDIGPVIIRGDFIGGSSTLSGLIEADTLASVTIGGSLIGGSGLQSGHIRGRRSATICIGGSVIGGNRFSGSIGIAENVGTMKIGGSLIGGSADGSTFLDRSGFISAKHIDNFTLGGSLIAGTDNTSGTFENNGAIRVDDDFGTILIKGNVIGNATNPAIISARGKKYPSPTADLAIGSLTVLGRVEFVQILAGVDISGAAKNADAQIGAVKIGGDWIASSIVAGAVPGGNGFYGNFDDVKMSGTGVKDDNQVVSKIASLIIGGQALGTEPSLSNTDHFGVVAENIGAVKIGGTPLTLLAGNGNDDFAVGITSDFRVREI